jgi:sodium-coupled neutral amino acid transporter 7/8
MSELQTLDEEGKKISESKPEYSELETDPEKTEDPLSKNFIEESEDNDGENRNLKEEDKVSLFSIIITIMKGMIGFGILNYPFAFKTLGFKYCLLSICIAVILIIFSVYFLLKAKDVTQRYGYSVYSKLSFGTSGTIIMMITMISNCFFVCCIYLKLFGNILRTLLLIFINDNGQVYLKENFLVFAIFIILLPLMFKKDISALSKYALIGIISIIIFICSLIIVFIYKLNNNEIDPIKEKHFKINGTFIEIFESSTAIFNSFNFHPNIFPIYLTLKSRSTIKMVKGTTIAVCLTSIIYILTGILGFLIYRDKINDFLLKYFTNDILTYLKTNKYIASVLIISEIGFFISTSLSIPLLFFACKNNFFNLIRFIKKKFSNKENLTSGLIDNKNKHHSLSSFGQNVIIIILYVSMLILAISVDKIIIIDNIVGSTASNIILFLAPGIFYLKFGKEKMFSIQKLMALLFVILGSGITILFIKIQIDKLLK